MTAGRAEAIAAELARQHEGREQSRPLPDELRPRDMDEAYDVQEAFVRLLRSEGGSHIAGWKVALTSNVMQQLCGVDQPAAGCLLSHRIHASGTEIRAADWLRIGVESEVAVRLGQDLPTAEGPHDRESAAAAVAACMAAIEIIDDRNADYSEIDLPTLVADNAWNGGVVLGPEMTGWRALDLAALRGRMVINGETAGEGHGRDVLGHPLESLAWLANHVNRRGAMLRAGDVIMTGSVVATKWLKPGDEMRTIFDALGESVVRVG
jgi:2-oxo-3-hexenedioate decarboxylase/2-keto-4-pentenoate hydratase